jgi:hypothetical protein
MKCLKILIFVLFLMILIGCNIPQFYFQYIEIPEYNDPEDYSPLIFSKNDEIVYNAVIMLISSASKIAENASDNSGDVKTYENSRKIFNRIIDLTNSRNPRIATGAIRFVSFCAADYKDKKFLIDKLLKIKSNNPTVLFEQVSALSLVADSSTKLNEKTVKKFLNSSSWLVSRESYNLINVLEDKNLRKAMIDKYDKTGEEYEKLLLLNCFKNNYDKNVLDFFIKELANGKINGRIRTYILKLLKNSKEVKPVIDYLNSNYKNFTVKDIDTICDENYEDIYKDFGTELFIMLIQKGFDPHLNIYSSENKIPKLYYYLIDKKNKDNEIKFLEIEKQILARQDLKGSWLKYKALNQK